MNNLSIEQKKSILMAAIEGDRETALNILSEANTACYFFNDGQAIKVKTDGTKKNIAVLPEKSTKPLIFIRGTVIPDKIGMPTIEVLNIQAAENVMKLFI